jgi:tRNA G46 methylase TrmB
VRAELLDFWRLALDEVKANRWSIPYHALYYPNPWPKQSEATRRFHLHPIFPTLLQLGDTIELRTNWEIYAREFEEAVRVAKSAAKILPIRGPCALSNKLLSAVRPHCAGMTTDRIAFTPKQPITAFERKYKEARQQLWRVVISNKT